jgi:hypothetical protein
MPAASGISGGFQMSHHLAAIVAPWHALPGRPR